MTLVDNRVARTSVISTLLWVAILPSAGEAVAQPLPSPGALAACVRQRADQEGFSGVISAVEQGRPLVTVARGERAGPRSAPITPDTRFNIGSASKMFTAVAIGQLVDAGKIRFDDTVGKYVVGLTPEASAVTIRQLLTHTSGLGDFFKPENFDTMEKARSANDILPLIAAEKPMFTPGDHFQYSNTGFALLGIIIERVSGETYGQYLQSHVFARAGMTMSGVNPEPLASLAVGMTRMQPGMEPGPSGPPGAGPTPDGAHILIGPDGARLPPGEGHRLLGPPPGPQPSGTSSPGAGLVLIGPHGERISPPAATGPLHPAPGATVYGTPAGGVFSTAVDIQKFTAALFDNRLTTPSTTLALTTQHVTPGPDAGGRGYGYGFGVRLDRGRQWVGHNGGTLGANAEISVDRSSGLSVAVLSNRDPPAATQMFGFIKDLLAEPAQVARCSRP